MADSGSPQTIGVQDAMEYHHIYGDENTSIVNSAPTTTIV